jgi:uncharacterized membrane protein YgcG
MPDQQMVCKDCNNTFTFTEGEQTFFREKGFSAPTRCSDCRKRRKAEKMNSGDGGGGYGGGSYGGGGYSSGGGGGRGRGGRSW